MSIHIRTWVIENFKIKAWADIAFPLYYTGVKREEMRSWEVEMEVNGGKRVNVREIRIWWGLFSCTKRPLYCMWSMFRNTIACFYILHCTKTLLQSYYGSLLHWQTKAHVHMCSVSLWMPRAAIFPNPRQPSLLCN